MNIEEVEIMFNKENRFTESCLLLMTAHALSLKEEHKEDKKDAIEKVKAMASSFSKEFNACDDDYTDANWSYSARKILREQKNMLNMVMEVIYQ